MMPCRSMKGTQLLEESSRESVLQKLGLGTSVKVTTMANEEIKGDVYAVDYVAHMLVLQQSLDYTTVKHDVRMFPFEAIEEIEILGSSENDNEAGCIASNIQGVIRTPFDCERISKEHLVSLEEKAHRSFLKAKARIGSNVSSDAQDIFDALCKTMPCEWEGQNIRVMDEVLIKPPYNVTNCSGFNVQVLSRVKKVMEGEKQKLMKSKQ